MIGSHLAALAAAAASSRSTNSGRTLRAEQLERLHDVLVAVASGLEHEDQLVHAGLLVAPEELPELVRGTDGPPEAGRPARRHGGAEGLAARRQGGRRRVAGPAPALLELRPYVGRRRDVLTEDVVVGQRIAEEVGALDPPADGLVLVLGAHHGGDAGDLGVDVPPDRHAPVAGGRLVVVHPGPGVLGFDEGEGQGAHPLFGRQQNGVAPAARHPQGRMRLLHGLGHDVAGRHGHEPALHAGEGRLDHAPQRHLEPLEPRCPLVGRVEEEPAELRLGAGLTRAELDAAAGDQIEHGHPLGRPGGVVVGRCRLDDAVADADAATSAGWRRPERPRVHWSGSTPRGSGAPPPTGTGCRGGRPARPGRGRP